MKAASAPPRPPRQVEFSFVSTPLFDRREMPDGSIVIKPRAVVDTVDVRTACAMLYGMDPDKLRELIRLGEIDAVRPNLEPGKPARNHKFRVSVKSVEEYRARMLASR